MQWGTQLNEADLELGLEFCSLPTGVYFLCCDEVAENIVGVRENWRTEHKLNSG